MLGGSRLTKAMASLLSWDFPLHLSYSHCIENSLYSTPNIILCIFNSGCRITLLFMNGMKGQELKNRGRFFFNLGCLYRGLPVKVLASDPNVWSLQPHVG